MNYMQKKKGFTMVELLVAMFIMVIAFGLVTHLYTRAARIRRIVVVHSELQQVMSDILDTLTYGEPGRWGFIHADEVEELRGPTEIVLINEQSSPREMEVRIDVDDPGTIAVGWGDFYANKIMLDTGNRINLNRDPADPDLPPSTFQCYDNTGRLLPPGDPDIANTTFIKITLWARSTDPAFRDAPPVPIVTGVRLRNNRPL